MRAITTDITIPVGRFIFRSIPGPGPQRSSPEVHRPYRVIVAKPGLDGHDRGAKVIARALRDAGFEVIYTGLHQTPEQVVQAVIQEDADAVGLSLLSGAHMTLFPRVIDLLKKESADEVRTHAGNILGMDIKGHVVHRVWIEHASDIAKEYYASFTLDRAAKKHLGMVSAKGGVDIEAVADEDPGAIARLYVDPAEGLSEAGARQLVDEAGLDPEARDGAVAILLSLYQCFVEGDADLVEINPLILTPDGRVHA